jgi:hypothetical protein
MRYHHLIALSESRGFYYDPDAPLQVKGGKSRLSNSPLTGREVNEETAGLICDLICDERDSVEIGDIIVLEGGWSFTLGAGEWERVRVNPENLIIR